MNTRLTFRDVGGADPVTVTVPGPVVLVYNVIRDNVRQSVARYTYPEGVWKLSNDHPSIMASDAGRMFSDVDIEQVNEAAVDPANEGGFLMPKYEHTHVSVRDGSPAMLVKYEGSNITLVNENGDVWTDSGEWWTPISTAEARLVSDLPAEHEHVFLVAVSVTTPRQREDAEKYLHLALNSRAVRGFWESASGRTYYDEADKTHVDCWWIAEDDRRDGSDNDSAVFVPYEKDKGLTQREARTILLGAWQIMANADGLTAELVVQVIQNPDVYPEPELKKWVVTGRSMVIEALDEEDAIQRADGQSGWHWEAEEQS